ncbi:MAG: M23 family metallopeptidase [Deltaproteobacteria bacterium]|nr:M23 family metallopeptidase [Deltaproteobacteria bacterium]
MHRRLSLVETFGLAPVSERLRETLLALRGDGLTPPSRFGVSSLGIFQPALAASLWLGLRPRDRRVPIYNFFNRTPTPEAEGWSVRKTQPCDFRGGTRTYDSHNGTDFAVSPGTVVVAAAPARVVRVSSEFNRGGLKVMLDHGHGVMTVSVHLGRALVRVGDVVARGEPVALSGTSGLDFIVSLGLSAPHVHYNVWLDGLPVDPFARPGEESLWRCRNDPAPHAGPPDAAVPATRFALERVAEGLAACRDQALASRIAALPDLGARAAALIFHLNYYPTRFTRRVSPYAEEHPRRGLLDLPFRAADFVGARL